MALALGRVQVAILTEQIAGLTRKLSDLEHYREDQANTKAQLIDAELQLRQAEQSHQQQLDELSQAARIKEAFMYKETEQKLARVRTFAQSAQQAAQCAQQGARPGATCLVLSGLPSKWGWALFYWL